MSASRRDKDATWRSPARLCRQLDWSKPRLIEKLQNGLCYRIVDPSGTFPEGHKINWADPLVQRYFDVEAGEVKIHVRRGSMVEWLPVGIEVLPLEVEVPAPSADASVTTPAPRRPSDAAVEQCFRDIMKKHPNDPPSENWMLAEMKQRLGASPGRQRVRDLWQRIAPEWKRPVGAPRKMISAKKSAE